MKKVICLVMLVSLVGWAAANDFHDGSSDGRWDNAANWSGGVPIDSTTAPNTATGAVGAPAGWVQWNNDVKHNNGKTSLIDAATTATAYGVSVGQFGAVSGLEMTGGVLQIGSWGFNIGKGGNGNAGHTGSHGTFDMSGGLVSAPWINLPNNWGTDPVIQGTWNMDGGDVYADWLRLGGDLGTGVGLLNLDGGTINLSGHLAITGVDSVIDFPEGSTGVINIHHVDFEGSLAAAMGEIQGWIGDGYIVGGGVSYDDVAQNIVVAVPEPATLSLLALGGLLLRRKKS